MTHPKLSTISFLVTLLVSFQTVRGENPDLELFDFREQDTSGDWLLNIFGTNKKGVKKGGQGKIESVAGRSAETKALRFSSEEAGSFNFISPEIPDGAWRDRKYYGAEICWRGDGSTDGMKISAINLQAEPAPQLNFLWLHPRAR